MEVASLIALGYLSGSLPTGVLVGRLAGADPRRKGSGNIGATNVARVLGARWGLLTLAVDMLKAAWPALLALAVSGLETAAATGFAATLGHCFPIWLRFRGGKGVATAFGALAAVAWPVAALSGVLWVFGAVLTRIPAIGSLVAAAAFVGLSVWDARPVAVQLLAIGLALLIVVRHQSNLRILRDRRRGGARRPFKRP